MIYKFSLIEKLLIANDIIPHPFVDAASSVGLGFALSTSIKLKIADALSLEFKELNQIAATCGCPPNGVELILDCLEALGYTKKEGSKYAFTKRGYKNLSPDSPDSFRWFILFCDWLYKGYVNIHETIRNGKPLGNTMWEDIDEHGWELYSRAMIDISRTNTKEVSTKVPVPKGATSMLDLGGSHGQYSIEICKKHPELKATILDLEPVGKYAAECITQHNMEKQVSFTVLDFMKNDLPQKTDVILAFNIIHGFPEADNKALTQKCFDSLNKGGIYVILDQIKGIGGSSQLSKATTSYMALNLLHQTGGRTYSHSEVDEWAKKSGFTKTELKKLNSPGFGVIVCYK